jgi:hypothetical protein
MFFTAKRLVIATAVGLYLYFLLPATAVLFYELYHLTGIDAIYWGYSAFKAGGYYFGTWQYQLFTCVIVSAAILLVPGLIQKVRQK